MGQQGSEDRGLWAVACGYPTLRRQDQANQGTGGVAQVPASWLTPADVLRALMGALLPPPGSQGRLLIPGVEGGTG